MAKSDSLSQLTLVEVQNRSELRAWLEANHQRTESFWLVTFKKGSPSYLDRFAVLEELICYGWIDGIRRKLDDTKTMQLISQRKTKPWAQSYKDLAEKLTAQGIMHESGLRAIEQAKLNGMWDLMESVDRLEVPQDLEEHFDLFPGSKANWDRFAPSARRNVLRWLFSAKTDQTRQKRLKLIASEAQQNRKAHTNS